jgi:lipoate-protein ligase A
MADGFAHALNLDLIPGDLTPHERDLATQLRRSRYAASEWNARA